jgi:hypothetical protein
MAKRTVLNFEANNDVWPIVENWAREREYREKMKGNNWRRYQQGYGMLVAPKLVEVHQEDRKVELQAWVSINIINRIITLFLMPAELDLGSGFMGSIPRNTARRDINILLQRLDQPPIGK